MTKNVESMRLVVSRYCYVQVQTPKMRYRGKNITWKADHDPIVRGQRAIRRDYEVGRKWDNSFDRVYWDMACE
jgi:hypothetical protein